MMDRLNEFRDQSADQAVDAAAAEQFTLSFHSNLYSEGTPPAPSKQEGDDCSEELLKSFDQVLARIHILSIGSVVRRNDDDVRQAPKTRAPPPLKSLIRCADFTGLKTRKQIKAMAGDMDAEIRRLKRERRPFAARWNIMLAWAYATTYVLRGLLPSITKLLGWMLPTGH